MSAVSTPSRWDSPLNKASRLLFADHRAYDRQVQSREAEARQAQAEQREAENELAAFISKRDAAEADLVARDFAPSDSELEEGIVREQLLRRKAELKKQAIKVHHQRVADSKAKQAAKHAEAVASLSPFVNELHQTQFNRARDVLSNLEDVFTELMVADLVRRELLGDYFKPERGAEVPLQFAETLKMFNATIPAQMRPDELHLEYFRAEAERRAREIVDNITGAATDEL